MIKYTQSQTALNNNPLNTRSNVSKSDKLPKFAPAKHLNAYRVPNTVNLPTTAKQNKCKQGKRIPLTLEQCENFYSKPITVSWFKTALRPFYKVQILSDEKYLYDTVIWLTNEQTGQQCRINFAFDEYGYITINCFNAERTRQWQFLTKIYNSCPAWLTEKNLTDYTRKTTKFIPRKDTYEGLITGKQLIKRLISTYSI